MLAMRIGDLKRTNEEFESAGLLGFDCNELWFYIMEGHKTVRHTGRRIIPIGLEAMDVLKPLIEKYKDDGPEQPIFRNSRGRRMTVAVYGRSISKTIKRYGLSKLVPYQLRHTALTNVSNDHDRDAARAIAGHTTDAMTARYDHGDLDKAIRVVMDQNRSYRSKSDSVPNFRIFRGE